MTGPDDPNDQSRVWPKRPGQDKGQEQPSVGPDRNSATPGPQLPGGGADDRNGGAGFRAAVGRVNVSAATTLLTAIPWFFWSFVVVSWIAGIIGFGWGWVLIVLWVLSGAVVFVRPVEELVAHYLFRLRKPTVVEQQRMTPIWQQLASRVGVNGDRFALWIQESEDVNATPTPGHTVAVSSWSLYNLSPSNLEAVLAHELSHHLDGRAWLSLLSFWYSIPARCALIAVRALVRLMKAVPAVGCAVGGFLIVGYLGILLAVLTFGDSLTFPLLFLTPFIAPPILAWFSRREVKRADQQAALLGYAEILVQVLYGWQLQHQQALGREANRRTLLMSSTPSVAERVQALEASGGKL